MNSRNIVYLLFIAETLDISSNSLTGTITDEFQQMTRLQNLHIDVNELDGKVEDALNCSNCIATMQRFRSRFNPLKGSIPPSLFGYSQLSLFMLSRSDVSGTIPTEFGLLTNLQNLELSVNPFFDQGTTIPSEIGSLTKLEILYFSGSSISGTVPSELSNLRRLKHLSLSETFLVGEIPQGICDIETLESITHPPDLVCECPTRVNLCKLVA
jgi:Leucine-rich repeat (LRR) protein